MIYIDSEQCTGCGICVGVCPTGAIGLVQDETKCTAEIDQTKCRQCQACIPVCPQEAIQAQVEPVAKQELVLTEPETVQVKARLAPARPTATVWKWVGPALSFLGREIVPRVATSLLDAWDRRAGTLSRPGDLASTPPPRQPMAGLPGAGGRRYRWRGGR